MEGTTTTTTTTTQHYQYGSSAEGATSGLEMRGATAGGLIMGFGTSGNMTGDATYSASATKADLGALGATTTSTQYRTTGTTTTTIVLNFTTNSQPIMGQRNVLESIVNNVCFIDFKNIFFLLKKWLNFQYFQVY